MSEPVAWLFRGHFYDTDPSDWTVHEHPNVPVIPLYTHPVKELDEQFKKGFKAGKEEGWKAHKFHYPVKELTDEEIIKVYEDMLGVASAKGSAIDFARAILKKASEKC